jgi:hypothetical protein
MMDDSKTIAKQFRSTRRSFVSLAASAAFGFTIVPRHVLRPGYIAPSEQLRVAGIGAGGMPQLLPGELLEQAQSVAHTLERSPGHYVEWYQACKSGKLPAASFDYSGPMTETVLLGVLSLRAPGRRLLWNSSELKVTNHPEMNQYVHTEYRKGWSL